MTLTDFQVVEALRAARIPARYHRPDCSLMKFDAPGAALAKWVQTEAARDLRAGQGWFVIGNNQQGVDCFFTLARALIVSGMSAKVFSLPLLVRLLGTQELSEELEDVSALFIAGFYEAKHSGACSAAQLHELEWFFRSRWNNDMAVFPLSSARIAACDWYSPAFLDALTTFTREVAI